MSKKRKNKDRTLTSSNAFGGAKVVYVAKKQEIKKESKQKELNDGFVVDHPEDADGDDKFQYYTNLTGFNSYHARCLRVLTDCTVNLGINFMAEEGAVKDITNRLAIVNIYGQSFAEVLARTCLDYFTTGNGYLEVVRNRAGEVQEYYYCPSTLTYVYKRNNAKGAFQYQNEDGSSTDFYPYIPEDTRSNSIIHFANYTQENRHYGLPDWRGAVKDIELEYYAKLYNKKFFVNSGIPEVAIVVEGGKFDKDVEDAVISFFQTNIKGVENAHKTLYLPINDKDITVKFEKLEMDRTRDGDFDKMSARCRDNIVSAHGVPPRLVGIVVSGSLGGSGEVEGQLKIFQEINISPRQEMFKTKLLPVIREMGFEIEDMQFVKLNTQIQEKLSTKLRLLTGGKQIMRINEAREELGLEPDDELSRQDTTEPPDTGNPEDKEKKLVDSLEQIRKSL